MQVNRIWTLSRHPRVLATSSDDEQVRIFSTQRASGEPNRPPTELDLRLVDNQERAPFVLATSPRGSFVASGTTSGERTVRVWDICDHFAVRTRGRSAKGTTTVNARSVFKGHERAVEDVCFRPNDMEKLAVFLEIDLSCCLIHVKARYLHAPSLSTGIQHNFAVLIGTLKSVHDCYRRRRWCSAFNGPAYP